MGGRRRGLVTRTAAEQIVGRERRERVSQLAWCGARCFDSRRRVNSTVVRFPLNVVNLFWKTNMVMRNLNLLVVFSLLTILSSLQSRTLAQTSPIDTALASQYFQEAQ